MAYLCCGISAAVTNAAVTMVVANWWIKIDAQTTGGLCVATMLLTMWLYRTPPEDIALPLGKKAAKAAAADDVDIILSGAQVTVPFLPSYVPTFLRSYFPAFLLSYVPTFLRS